MYENEVVKWKDCRDFIDSLLRESQGIECINFHLALVAIEDKIEYWSKFAQYDLFN